VASDDEADEDTAMEDFDFPISDEDVSEATDTPPGHSRRVRGPANTTPVVPVRSRPLRNSTAVREVSRKRKKVVSSSDEE
jgi:hypothetical protein